MLLCCPLLRHHLETKELQKFQKALVIPDQQNLLQLRKDHTNITKVRTMELGPRVCRCILPRHLFKPPNAYNPFSIQKGAFCSFQ